MNHHRHVAALLIGTLLATAALAESTTRPSDAILPYFQPPKEFAGQFGNYRSPLRFDDGSPVKTVQDWPRRRQEILSYWHRELGPWPPLIDRPKIEYVSTSPRENFSQHKVLVQIAKDQTVPGYC